MEKTGLFYINSVRNESYYDLYLNGCEDTLTTYKTELKKYACNCDCITNEIGASYCYFSIRRKGSSPVVCFSKSARKRNNVISVCTCSQAAVFDSDAEKMNEGLDSIFAYPLYTEEQIDAFDIFAQDANSTEGNETFSRVDVKCSKTVIKAILYRIMQRWLMGDKQLSIAVPATVKDYNGYVLSAAEKIYSYFPTAMKLETGFSSYLAPEKYQSMQRLYLIFAPEPEAGNEKIYLDGANLDFANRIIANSSLPEGIKIFIDVILGYDTDAERKKFLTSVFEDVENNPGFSPTDYGKAGKELEVAKLGFVDENNLLSYANYLIKAEKGENKLKSFEATIISRIQSNLKNESINNYIGSRAESLSEVSKQLERIRQILPVLRICPEQKKYVWEKCKSYFDIQNYKTNSESTTYSALLTEYRKHSELFLSISEKENVRQLEEQLIASTVQECVTREKESLSSMNRSNKSFSTWETDVRAELDRFSSELKEIVPEEKKTRIVSELEKIAIEKVKKELSDLFYEVDGLTDQMQKRRELSSLQLRIETIKNFDKDNFRDIRNKINSGIKSIDDEEKKRKYEEDKRKQEVQSKSDNACNSDAKKNSDLERKINRLRGERDSAKKRSLIAFIAAGIFLLALIVGALVVFVFNSPYKTIENISAEKEALEEKNTALKTSIEKLKEPLTAVSEAYSGLKNDVEMLTSETKVLQDQASALFIPTEISDETEYSSETTLNSVNLEKYNADFLSEFDAIETNMEKLKTALDEASRIATADKPESEPSITENGENSEQTTVSAEAEAETANPEIQIIPSATE